MNNLHSSRIFSHILTVALFLIVDFVFAQSTLYEMGIFAEVEYVCGEDALFTDNNIIEGGGGAQNPYDCNNSTITFCPSVANTAVQLSFAVFDLQTNANPDNNDVLFVYDGPSS